MSKITEIWVCMDTIVILRDQGRRTYHHVTQGRLSRLTTVFTMMKIQGEIDVWPSGLGYYVERIKE